MFSWQQAIRLLSGSVDKSGITDEVVLQREPSDFTSRFAVVPHSLDDSPKGISLYPIIQPICYRVYHSARVSRELLIWRTDRVRLARLLSRYMPRGWFAAQCERDWWLIEVPDITTRCSRDARATRQYCRVGKSGGAVSFDWKWHEGKLLLPAVQPEQQCDRAWGAYRNQ
ncbi:MAG: hypothetical protein KDH90_08310 [Anaerolineae bacterium]|nr:hypothetical protein [Anaerolineae bacterium]